MMKYYKISPDEDMPQGYWYLDGAVLPDGERLGYSLWLGKKVNLPSIPTSKAFVPGRPLDITFNSDLILVVSARIADALRAEWPDEIQLFRSSVEGYDGEYFLVNVLRLENCIDERRTAVCVKWGTDAPTPEEVGTYKMLFDIKVDPARVAGSNIFRIDGYSVILVCSDKVMKTLTDLRATGVVFRDVN